MSESNIIEELYKLRSNFVVIGLTGRTGSGCSTVAKLLQSQNFSVFNPPRPIESDRLSNDERKYKITYKYLENNWKKFHVIKASDVITYFVDLLTLPAQRVKGQKTIFIQ